MVSRAEERFLENEHIKNLIEANVITKNQARRHFYLRVLLRRGKGLRTDDMAFVLMLILKDEYKNKDNYANLSPVYHEFARYFYNKNDPDFFHYLKCSAQAQLNFFKEKEAKKVNVTNKHKACINCTFTHGEELIIEQAMKGKKIPNENCTNKLYPQGSEGWCTCEYDSMIVSIREWISPSFSDAKLILVSILKSNELPGDIWV